MFGADEPRHRAEQPEQPVGEILGEAVVVVRFLLARVLGFVRIPIVLLDTVVDGVLVALVVVLVAFGGRLLADGEGTARLVVGRDEPVLVAARLEDPDVELGGQVRPALDRPGDRVALLAVDLECDPSGAVLRPGVFDCRRDRRRLALLDDRPIGQLGDLEAARKRLGFQYLAAAFVDDAVLGVELDLDALADPKRREIPRRPETPVRGDVHVVDRDPRRRRAVVGDDLDVELRVGRDVRLAGQGDVRPVRQRHRTVGRGLVVLGEGLLDPKRRRHRLAGRRAAEIREMLGAVVGRLRGRVEGGGPIREPARIEAIPLVVHRLVAVLELEVGRLAGPETAVEGARIAGVDDEIEPLADGIVLIDRLRDHERLAVRCAPEIEFGRDLVGRKLPLDRLEDHSFVVIQQLLGVSRVDAVLELRLRLAVEIV